MSAAKQFPSPEDALMPSAEAVLAREASRRLALAHSSPPEVQIGSVMIQEGALLPEGLKLESDRYTVGWRAVRTINGFGVDRKIRSAGWNLFLIAGEVRTIAFGSATNNTLRALIRVLARVRALRFNSAEITALARRRFLGIPYTAVTVQARHIQPGYVLQSARMRAPRNPEWARG